MMPKSFSELICGLLSVILALDISWVLIAQHDMDARVAVLGLLGTAVGFYLRGRVEERKP